MSEIDSTRLWFPPCSETAVAAWTRATKRASFTTVQGSCPLFGLVEGTVALAPVVGAAGGGGGGGGGGAGKAAAIGLRRFESGPSESPTPTEEILIVRCSFLRGRVEDFQHALAGDRNPGRGLRAVESGEPCSCCHLPQEENMQIRSKTKIVYCAARRKLCATNLCAAKIAKLCAAKIAKHASEKIRL
mmetsp:Transcript_19739/g.49610  ORF Transcript_19739/g.49610 Transcript_19739/m.49610 type:complete len:188 (+) Transcript_19739:598-1161(+)